MTGTSTWQRMWPFARLTKTAKAAQAHSTPQATDTSTKQQPHFAGVQAFMHAPGKPVWMRRDYARFADEAYGRNVVAHRAIAMIASGAASVGWRLFARPQAGQTAPEQLARHAALDLLTRPNPFQGKAALWEAVYTHRLLSGNAYVHAVGAQGEAPMELHALRPDRVAVIAGRDGLPQGYRYSAGERYTDYPLDRVSGQSRVLHVKSVHPLDDWYGLSPVEAAAYSIDQHNQAGAWNQALLQNGARPSGALVVKGAEGQGYLSEEQYYRMKQQVDEQFSGAANAGRPLLLEGGLEWKDMSLSPRDMDFIEAKHSSARDIALAFGVPPQLLGIPGDNTYSNLAEARLALWEQTVLPLVQQVTDGLNNWLLPMFDGNLFLQADLDAVSALSLKRERLWERVKGADFLSDEEKRKMVGY